VVVVVVVVDGAFSTAAVVRYMAFFMSSMF